MVASGLLGSGQLVSQALASEKNQPTAPVDLGIDVLAGIGFKRLEGKRVGLLTHPAGVNKSGKSTVDVLRGSRAVKLVALFGPEHGIYGNEKASQPIDDKVDARTGLPVFSLYGKYRSPTPAMLANIDILVVDLQDVGTRSYTFVSCMKRAMRACFENDVEVMVLDRPNPLGGEKVDGPMLDVALMSYVGDVKTPYVHGLTIGELANLLKKVPRWLDLPDLGSPCDDAVQKNGKLFIVPMRGWKRSMLWPTTGLRWVPTSPFIPDFAAVAGYPMTGLGAEVGGWGHGIGSPFPFRLLTHSERSLDALQQELSSLGIAGLGFQRLDFTNSRGKKDSGLYTVIKDWSKLSPTELSFQMMRLTTQWADSNPFAQLDAQKRRMFNIHVGSQEWWEEISTRGKNARFDAFLQAWQQRAIAFKSQTAPFKLY